MKKKTNKQKGMGSRATAHYFLLILYSSNPTLESGHSFEVRQFCVYVSVCVFAHVCVLKKEVKATTVGLLLSHPPTRVARARDSLMSMGFIASISPP